LKVYTCLNRSNLSNLMARNSPAAGAASRVIAGRARERDRPWPAPNAAAVALPEAAGTGLGSAGPFSASARFGLRSFLHFLHNSLIAKSDLDKHDAPI
jgi:hypothetical protein